MPWFFQPCHHRPRPSAATGGGGGPDIILLDTWDIPPIEGFRQTMQAFKEPVENVRWVFAFVIPTGQLGGGADLWWRIPFQPGSVTPITRTATPPAPRSGNWSFSPCTDTPDTSQMVHVINQFRRFFDEFTVSVDIWRLPKRPTWLWDFFIADPRGPNHSHMSTTATLRA